MVGYLRQVCRPFFFKERMEETGFNESSRILLVKCVNLFYERYIFGQYKQVL